MKQNKVEYLVDSFKDCKGNEYTILACAVFREIEPDDFGTLTIGWTDSQNYMSKQESAKVKDALTVTTFVYGPKESYDLHTEMQKAYYAAINDSYSPALYSISDDVLGSKIAKAFMEQEIEAIKEHPEEYIDGYEEDNSEETQKLNSKELKLMEILQQFTELLKHE